MIKKGIKSKKPIKKKRNKTSRKIKKLEIFQTIHKPKIRVIGIGGGGGSIINEIALTMKKIDFIAANTDIQALKKLNKKTKKFSFGKSLTYGLGTGMNPKLGELAAQNEKDKIKRLMEDQDLCILVSCLGGGTGSGAAPLFAEVAKEVDILTFGIFTMPFKFEGSKKMKIAKRTLKALTSSLNAVCVIPNQRIFQIINQKTPLRKALSALNKILAEDLKGLIEFIYWPGLINIDFADLKAILEGRGKRAYLNSAKSQGKNMVEDVVEKVLNSSLYQYGISGTDRILFNIEGGKDLKMSEVEQISKNIYSFNPRAKIIFGVAQYPKYKNKIKITLLAVTPGKKKEKRKKKKPISAIEPKKELIEEKLDMPLEKIESSSSGLIHEVKLRKAKKIKITTKKKIKKKIKKKRKPKVKKQSGEKVEGRKEAKRTKKQKGKKKAKSKERKITISKSAKTIHKKKINSPLSPPSSRLRRPRNMQKSRKAKKTKKSIKKTTVPKKKSVIKAVKEEEAKPEQISPYNEILNTQTQTEKIRKNALDLQREAQEVKKEMEKREKRWDIPAFLRRKKPEL